MTDTNVSGGPVRFDGRVAVVTGAGGGLGREHARLLAARGAAVVVNDVGGFDPVSNRMLGDAATVVGEIVAEGGQATASPDDIATSAGAAALIDQALDTFGRLDIVINNAGILRSADFDDMTEAIWDEVMNVNLRGAYLVTRAAWPHLRAQRYGRVLFTTSNSGLLGVPGSTAYAASKAGLWGLTRVLALEGQSTGIHTNAIAPIAFTDMSRQSRAVPQAWRDGTDEWGVRLQPRYIAVVAAWLVAEACPWNGEVLSAAAGRAARFFMGLTPGFADEDLSMETVRDHAADILLEDGYEVLDRAFEEGRRLRRRLLGGRHSPSS